MLISNVYLPAAVFLAFGFILPKMFTLTGVVYLEASYGSKCYTRKLDDIGF